MRLFLCKLLLRVLYWLTPQGYSMRAWRWKAWSSRPGHGDAEIRDCPISNVVHWRLRAKGRETP